jgi:hypothetical protein
VKVEQALDKVCNSTDVGKFLGKSKYFYDGVIPEANERRTQVVSSQGIGKGSELNHDTIYAAHPGRKRTGNFMYTLLLAQNEAGRRKLRQGM